jgi:hypothetical protein
MKKHMKTFRIFIFALIAAISVVVVKYFIHLFNFELVEQSSLHNGVLSSVTFVLGFLLSATISDYKESERIPSDFAAQVEDMYDDASMIHQNYPVFDLDGFRKQLRKVTLGFGKDVRKRSYNARVDIKGLAPFFAEMEKGKVPPNFIVKLKQQQTLLLRHRHRVNYIQRIKFIPSATILARSIVVLTILLLLVTNVDPFLGGLAICGIITFVLVYMLILIQVISLPFHRAGKTRDDVSLFLVEDALNYLSKEEELAEKSKL